jgi:Kdo2-lipid IVA lauroyltransferase/acyltransferase
MRFKHRLEVNIVKAGLKLGNLFSWRWISGTGAALGFFVCHLLRIRRQVVRDNLLVAFGDTITDAERERIVGRCYVEMGRTWLEYFALPALGRRGILEQMEFQGEEHLRAALAGGKGVFLLGAHFGNWELSALAIGSLGIPVHPIVGDLSNKSVDLVMNEMRQKLGLIIERRGMGLRSVFKALRQGDGVGFQADQEARHHGVNVPFFGVESLTHPGAAWISLRTGAPILPCYCLRIKGGFRMIFRDPIWPGDEADEQSVRELTARHTQVTEQMIRRYPEQWFWMHERWKKAPRDSEGQLLKMSWPPASEDNNPCNSSC